MSRDRSWTRAGIGESAYAALASGMPPSAVWSLLMEVFAERAAQRTPPNLLQQFQRDGFTRPAVVDQRTLVALDAHLLAAAANFEAIELSPLAPLGACSAVGLASQNKIVSALRGTEVVSDPTNVLALECGRRLSEDPTQTVRLATCHRCVRAQEIPKRPGYGPHFRIFCLATAAHEMRDQGVVVATLAEHIATHLRALERLEAHGYRFPDRRVTILATPARAALADRIAEHVAGAPVTRGVLEHPYYHGLRFLIGVRAPSGDEVPLIDGGAFDWLGKLTSNRKLSFVASGMGSQLAAYVFRSEATDEHR